MNKPLCTSPSLSRCHAAPVTQDLFGWWRCGECGRIQPDAPTSDIRPDGYVYLASPYSHPEAAVRHARYEAARDATAAMLRRKEWCYSPIVHGHDLTVAGDFPADAKFWQDFNHVMLDASIGLVVLKIPGWHESLGVAEEIAYAKGRGLDIGECYLPLPPMPKWEPK